MLQLRLVEKSLWKHARILVLIVAAVGCGRRAPGDAGELRVGYFPNITHAQALVGLSNGSFQQALGESCRIKPFVFNAGPSVIEAFFAGELDLAYIGPNPAVNGYVKSGGRALRIVAGAASGGAVMVVRAGADIRSPQDLEGKRVASPQLGNTQDVALRHYLKQHGLKTREQGGSVWVRPLQNADILTAFLKQELDAAWVPEPWGARLVHETGASIWFDERELWPDGRFATAVVIASSALLQHHPELVGKWLKAHVEITRWIAANPEEAKQLVNGQLLRLTGKELSREVLDDAWSRLELTYQPMQGALLHATQQAFELGFLGEAQPDLGGLYDLTPLRQALAANGLTLQAER